MEDFVSLHHTNFFAADIQLGAPIAHTSRYLNLCTDDLRKPLRVYNTEPVFPTLPYPVALPYPARLEKSCFNVHSIRDYNFQRL